MTTTYDRPVLRSRIPQLPTILEDDEETDTASIWPDTNEDGCDFPCIICGDTVPNECSWHPFCSRGCFVDTLYETDDDCDY